MDIHMILVLEGRRIAKGIEFPKKGEEYFICDLRDNNKNWFYLIPNVLFKYN